MGSRLTITTVKTTRNISQTINRCYLCQNTVPRNQSPGYIIRILYILCTWYDTTYQVPGTKQLSRRRRYTCGKYIYTEHNTHSQCAQYIWQTAQPRKAVHMTVTILYTHSSRPTAQHATRWLRNYPARRRRVANRQALLLVALRETNTN